MKLIYKGARSGDKQMFPFVGVWKNGEIKDVKNEEQAKKLLENFQYIKKINDVGISKSQEKRISLQNKINIEEDISQKDVTIGNQKKLIEKPIDKKTRDELIADCILKGIDPPDKATKSELKEILRNANNNI